MINSLLEPHQLPILESTITKTQAANILGISVKQLGRWIEAKYLSTTRGIGGTQFHKDMIDPKDLPKAKELALKHKQAKPVSTRAKKVSPYATKAEIEQIITKLDLNMETYNQNVQKFYNKMNTDNRIFREHLNLMESKVIDCVNTVSRFNSQVRQLLTDVSQLKAELTALKPTSSSESEEPDRNKSALQEWT